MHSKFALGATIIIGILLAVTSCGGKKETEHKENPMVRQLDDTPDSALFVMLEDVEDDSIIVTNLETGDIEAYYYKGAKVRGKIKGSLTKGDRFSIFPNRKEQSISIAINATELSGRWFYDMQQHRGLKFEERGSLSSINTSTIAFREWKLLNGKLYIYYVDMQQVADDRHEFSVEEAQIKYLSKDELKFHFIGKDFDCKREVGLLMLKDIKK